MKFKMDKIILSSYVVISEILLFVVIIKISTCPTPASANTVLIKSIMFIIGQLWIGLLLVLVLMIIEALKKWWKWLQK